MSTTTTTTTATTSATPASDEKIAPPQRIDLAKHSGAAYRAMMQLEQTVAGLGLEPSLRELVKIRASQLNGCAFCLDMHVLDAAESGEAQQRMHALNAWRETPFFTARERAALAYTEDATLLAERGVSDEVFDELGAHFDESEVAALVWAVAAINTWNRLNVSARLAPGNYRPGSRPRAGS